MQTARPIKSIPCKYCGSPVMYNQEIKAFCNYGGEYDGLIHKDKRTGNTIESTAADVKRILEEVCLLRSEFERLRTSNWELHMKTDDLLRKVIK